MNPWLASFGFLALGSVFVGLAWMLLAEYRRAFFNDPGAIMSLEVLANILRLGGPGYLAILALIAGLPMLFTGFIISVVMVWFYVRTLVQAILTTWGIA